MPLFDLSDRVKLRLTGSDRVRFLNGQVTNDVRKASPSQSIPACVVSAKGKIDALILVGTENDAFLIDADPDLKTTLAARLDRYLIADDVVIEDVTENFALFHATAERAPALPDETHWRRARRFGINGWDLLVPMPAREQTSHLLAAKEPICKAAEAERWRIEQGVPRWGCELTEEIIPVEANLEADAIDYAKGCYIGQEVISRMKMSGQTNKRLRGLHSLEGAALAPGMRLLMTDHAREVGWITSATRSDRLDKEIALGYVRRGANEVGTRLVARRTDGSTTAVEVVELPFR